MKFALTRIFSLTAFALALIAGATAAAQPEDGPHVKASLVAETQNIVPGQKLHLAIRQQIQPHWHTYWVNPGDAGLPTTMDWALPPGFTADPIAWPVPKRIMTGPLVSYGYEREALLPITITVPSGLQSGTNATLSGHASWLVCAEVCVPEEGDLTLTLPVSSGPATPDPTWAPAFAAAESAAPGPNPFPTTATVAGNAVTLHVATGDARKLTDVEFFPSDTGAVDIDVPQQVVAGADGVTVKLSRGELKKPLAALNGVLAFRDRSTGGDGVVRAVMIATPAVAAPAGTATQGAVSVGLLEALLLAIGGGIILNLMPCVLPVLSIKALSLVKHAQSAPREVRLQGLAYAAGVLVSFGLVAGALIALRAAGAGIGWGFQLQSPIFVTLMIYVLFAVGLSLSGVFTVGDGLAGMGSDLADRDGYSGSFFTGALATLVATPCTAPFMAAAIGYAITQPWYASFAVFEAVGVGLALPYVVLAFSPGARRFLPKPGAWMNWFKQILAFPVYGTAVWLFFVLSAESGSLGATAALAGLVLIAFAAWLYEMVRLGEGNGRRVALAISAVALIGALALLTIPGSDAASTAEATGPIEASGMIWQPFTEAKLDAARADGKPVFVDFTADWCITCKVNERVALNDSAVRQAFADQGVVALRGDWTRRDATITHILEANGRGGVPLYLFYPKGRPGDATVLPQILTADTVLHELNGG